MMPKYFAQNQKDDMAFIWMQSDGSLQAARGQARIESYKQMMALINKAKKAGFFQDLKGSKV